MAAIWIAGALLLGLAVSRIGLPPLVGFLASGFVFAALGMERTPMLADLAHAGVLLLLFAVGFKLRIKTLAALRGVGHGDLAPFFDGHHRRCSGGDRRLALAGLGARVGHQLRFLEHRARCEGARRQSRAARRARPRRDRHLDRARRRGRRAACVRQCGDAVAVRGAAAARAVRAARDRLVARALRPRRAARAVRRGARDRRRRGVRGARLERGARGAVARHDARGSQALARADERAVEPEGAVPRRLLLEHRFQRAADLGWR